MRWRRSLPGACLLSAAVLSFAPVAPACALAKRAVATGATIITTVLRTLIDRIDLHMTLPAAVAAPRASQRNSATGQAEPAFIAQPTTAGLEQLGQSFAISDTSPLDPSITTAPTIGVESALEPFGHARMLAAAEPVRRGGGSAGVIKPAR